MVDDIEDKFDSLSLDDLKEKLDKVWDKIKMSRKRGLEEGEFGVGNLVFKLLVGFVNGIYVYSLISSLLNIIFRII